MGNECNLRLVELYPNKTLPPEPVEPFIAPSENEIKQWIDGKDTVTQTELMKFMRGYYTGKRYGRFSKWWLYVIETKNLTKLREYAVQKQQQGRFNIKLFNEIKKAYIKDTRIQEAGVKMGTKLLNSLYGINVAITTYRSYLKRIKYELV